MISAIRQKLSTQAGRAVTNTGWVFLDRIFRMAAGLLIGIWAARYLGPEQFGLLNYAAIFPSALLSVANLGLTSLLITELVRKSSYSENEVLGTGFVLKFLAGIVSFLLIVGLSFFLHQDQVLMRWMIFLSSFILIFQSLDVIDLFFQSKVKSKQSVKAKTIALLITTSIRIIFLLQQSSLLSFSFLILVEITISSLMMVTLYNQESNQNIRRWQFNKTLARYLFRSSWPIMMSDFFIFIYMRVNIFMLGNLAPTMELGKFSAALKLSELWYFIAIAINTSFYPIIVKLKDKDEDSFLRGYQQLLSFLAMISISIGIGVTLFAQPIINLIYGSNYSGTTQILIIHIWSGLFVFLGVGSGNWYVLKGLQRFMLYKTVAGAVLNIILNSILIVKFGAVGASIATLLAYALSAYFMNFFFKETRPLFNMQSIAIGDSFRISTLKSFWQQVHTKA